MSSLKALAGNYLSHLVGYALGAAGVVSALNPKLLPPQYSWIVSVAGLVVTAAHNGYKAGTLQAVANAAVSAAAANVTKALIPLFAVAVLFSGCATVAKVDAAVTSPQAQPLINAAALVAVGTAEQHGITAAQINTIAKAALAADSGTAATLSAVGAVVNAEVTKLKLPADDAAAIGIVDATLGAYIEQQVGSNATLAQTQAAAADVFKAIIAATGG